MSKAKKRMPAKASNLNAPIVVDEAKQLVFSSENEAYKYFSKYIDRLEEEHVSQRSNFDFPLRRFKNSDEHLRDTLLTPDEVWKKQSEGSDPAVQTYIKKFNHDNKEYFYVAVAYVSNFRPTFVFIHFPTRFKELAESYRQDQKIYDRAQGTSFVHQVDIPSPDDELAIGLYQAMKKLRAKTDIAEKEFKEFLQYRDETLENPKEIWRSTGVKGSSLVTFIKEYNPGSSQSFFYVVVTAEEIVSESHYLLFSFPTKDEGLLQRYRFGEEMTPENFIREESH